DLQGRRLWYRGGPLRDPAPPHRGGPPAARRVSGGEGLMNRSWLAPAALVLAAVSLCSNLLLVHRRRNPEAVVAPIVARLTQGLVDPDGVIRHEVTLPAGTPLSLDIPVNERFSVAVDTVIPLNTTIEVPIRGPLGVARVPIPIRADIP